MALTEEQKRQIEKNRQEALRRRAERERLNGKNNVAPSNVHSSFVNNKSKPTNASGVINKPNVPVRIAVKFSLKSKDKFELFFPFNQTMVEVCRATPSSNFDAKTKTWSFDLLQYRNLLSSLTKLEPTNNIKLELLKGIPEFVIQALLKELKRPQPDIDLSTALPKRLCEALYSFQKEGVQFAISRDGRCLISDDMGLGKTIQALATAHYFKKDWPLLIVCPSSLRFQWKRSIGEWFDDVSEDRDVEVVVDGRKEIPNNKIVIISYDLLLKIKPTNDKTFKMIILDESHYIKNDAAQRTKNALRLARSCKRVILLSGTPALSRPIELFTQLQAIDPKTFSKKHDFGMRYCNGQATAWGYDYRGSSNSEELRILLEATVMIRRLKVDVLQELPAKRRTVVALDIDLPPKAKELMSKFKSRVHLESIEDMNNAEQRNIMFQWYVSTAEVKAEPVCNYITELVEQERKFICFGHHKVMLDAICATLEEKRISYIRIDGSTPSECRQDCCDYFQTQDKCKVAVMGITSAGMGITLTAAQLVVFAELYYNPGVLTQAEDRAHRIGQKDSVLIQYLIAPSTVDDHIWPLINSKFKVLNKVGLTKDNFGEANEARKAAKKQIKNGRIDQFVSKRPRDKDDANNSSCQEMSDLSDDIIDQASCQSTIIDESFQMDHLNEEILLTEDEDEFKFDDDDDLLNENFNFGLDDSIAGTEILDNLQLDDADVLYDQSF